MKTEKIPYTTYCIKPLIYTTTTIGQREKILRSFRSIPTPIFFYVKGNVDWFWLELSIASTHENYIEATFASTYDYIKLEKKLSHQENQKLVSNKKNNQTEQYPTYTVQEYITTTYSSKIATTDFFFHNNTYLDPFKDILQIFHLVDSSSQLTLTYTIKQIVEQVGIRSRFRQLFILPKKHEKSEEPIYKTSISYVLTTNNTEVIKTVQDTLQSLFYAYCIEGNITTSKTPKHVDLTINQLSNFFHIPTHPTPIKGLLYMQYKELPYPPSIQITHKNIKIWYATYRQEERDVFLNYEDMIKHTYIIGKTGTGKSTLLANIFTQFMQYNIGSCIVDPHWDLVDTCLYHIPSFRYNDVVLIDISDTEFPIWLNLLQYTTEEEKNLLVSGIISVFYKLFSYSRWPRLEHTLRNALYATIEYPKATLLHVLQFLVNTKFRKKILEYVKDPIIKTFRENEFNERSEKQRLETIWPITNKIWQFLSSSLARNIFWQPQSKLDIGKAIETGKLIFVNLSKGKIGEDMANMIWSLIVTKIQIEIMKRASVPYEQRQPFFLCIDEFQNFTTDSFTTILSEARKYKLGLILAHQYLDQLPPHMIKAILGNVRTIISFNVSFSDAEYIAREYRWMRPEDFTVLPDYTAYCISINKQYSTETFCLHTTKLPKQKIPQTDIQTIITQSRTRYAVPKEQIETLIQKQNEETEKEEWEKTNSYLDLKNNHQKQEINIWQKTTSENYFTIIPEKEQKENINIKTYDKLKDTDEKTQNEKIKNWWNKQTIELPPIGSVCSWKIKFLFNYGIFVTYEQWEWLLHKNDIVTPPEIKRKKYYHENDLITVIVKWYKQINGETKIIWTQKI